MKYFVGKLFADKTDAEKQADKEAVEKAVASAREKDQFYREWDAQHCPNREREEEFFYD